MSGTDLRLQDAIKEVLRARGVDMPDVVDVAFVAAQAVEQYRTREVEPPLRAVDYAALVGRWVDMTRPATADETRAGDPPTAGMRCLVEAVIDTPDGVAVVSDEGLTFRITPDDRREWRFVIAATKEILR